MWDMFLVAYFICLLLLYVPGILFFRLCGCAGVKAVAAAPVFSLFIFGVTGIVFQKIGFECPWFVLPFVALCASVFGLLVRRLLKTDSAVLKSKGSTTWPILASYLVVGVAITINMFVAPLDGPESFQQTFDNPNHLTLIQSMATSGCFSPISANYYPDVVEGDFAGSYSFYPSMWHVIAALLVLALHISVPMAANVVVAAFSSVVFPLSIFYMLGSIFNTRRLVFLGVAFVLSFLIFPWVFYWAGPLFPNASSFAVAPIIAGCFIRMIKQKGSVRVLAYRLICIAAGLVVLLFLHPNTIFMLIVFLCPLCVSELYGHLRSHGKVKAGFAAAGFVLLTIIVWTIAFNLPMLQGTVTYSWDAFTYPAQAVANILFYSFKYEGVQILLALLVLLGLVTALKRREYRWIGCAYLVFCLLYFVTATNSDGFLKAYLTGFWYTDANRIAACLIVSCIPLACLGTDWALGAVLKAMKRRGSLSPRKERVASLGAVVLVLVLNFYPSFVVYGVCSYSSPFSTYKDAMANLNNGVTFNAYGPEEREFVKKCGEVVPEGDLVANFPYDGSSMAYGIDDLSVVFRAYFDFSYEGNPELLKRIDDVLWDSEVREFLQRNNIQYLLLLDCYQDVDNESFAFFDHENEEERRVQWEGILSVEDGTPGFEVVLSEGDMRLYKIVY